MKKLLSILFIATFLNGLSWLVLIPIWQYPDEQAHFAQVQDMAETENVYIKKNFDTSYEIALSEIILGTARNTFGNNKFVYNPYFRIEYSNTQYGLREFEIQALSKQSMRLMVKDEATKNPPLYYYLGSIIYRLVYDGSIFTRVFAVRILSLLFFSLSVFVTYKIGEIVFEKDKLLSLTLPTLVAFKPMIVFSSTGVLPDSLTNLLFSVILLMSLKIIKGELNFVNLTLAALTIIFGVITRQQFLISFLILIFAIILRVKSNFQSVRHVIFVIVIFLLFLLFANRYGLNVPIISHFRLAELLNLNIEKISLYSFLDYAIWTLQHTFSEVWPWYWGVYRWLSLTLPPIYYQIVNRLIILAAMGLVIKFAILFRKKEIKKYDVYLIFLVLTSFIYFTIITVWDYLFKLKSGFSFGIQGRYFFPLVTAHMAILVYGFWQIFSILLKKFKNYAILFIVLLMILFNDLTIYHIALSYYETSNLEIFITQASQYKPYFIKGLPIITILVGTVFSQIIYILLLNRYVR